MASRFLNLRGVPDQGLGKEGLSRVTGLQTERFEAKSSFANTTADASHSGDQQPGGTRPCGSEAAIVTGTSVDNAELADMRIY